MSKVIHAPRPAPWNPAHPWYQAASIGQECLDPTTARRVPQCNCRLCKSKLTDPKLVQGAR